MSVLSGSWLSGRLAASAGGAQFDAARPGPRREHGASALIAAWTGFLDLLAIPAGTTAYRTALVHMTLNLTVIGAYAAGFVWRYGVRVADEAIQVTGYTRPGAADPAQWTPADRS